MFCPEGACPFKDACEQRIYRAALVYAALGYAVYPASGGNTMAHVSHIGHFERGHGGFRQATTDLEKLTSTIWREAWGMPGTAIGLATGAPSRLVVIDIDPEMLKPDTSNGSITFSDTAIPDPKPAQRVRDWAAERSLLLPGNVRATTPTGGGHVHLWMRIPEGWAEQIPRKIGWFENVDLCAENHSIKAPPSYRLATDEKSGGAYTFTQGCPCEVPDASPELLSAFIDTPSTGNTEERAARRTDDTEGSGDIQDGRMDVDTMADTGVQRNQNFEFKRMACSMVARGWDRGHIIDKLMEAADNSPTLREGWPWTRTDMERMERDARNYIEASRKEEDRRNREHLKSIPRRFV